MSYKRPNRIEIGHGSGGLLSRELIEGVILPGIGGNEYLDSLDDGAVFDCPANRLAFTTDSYVVKPLTFPGGDIGKLAICGTINDLASMGAVPLFLSLSLIIEAGLEISILERILDSIKTLTDSSGIQIVTGDTKVVSAGECDQLFINTGGVGAVQPRADLSKERIRAGDLVIINGSIAEHGMAVMSVREDLGLQANKLVSDCAPLSDLVGEVIEVAGDGVKVMRDPTRGGLATTLNELVGQSRMIEVWEDKIPLAQPVNAICELLGFDPLYVANEGKMVFIVEPGKGETVLKTLKNHRLGKDAAIIGEVKEGEESLVYLKTIIGGERILDRLTGSQLPRIC